jgi:hypothetical protein
MPSKQSKMRSYFMGSHLPGCLFQRFRCWCPISLAKGSRCVSFWSYKPSSGLAVAILEVPSGYLADIWGRRNTMLIGAVFSGIGFTYFVFCETYFEFLMFELALAVSLSMNSGADFSCFMTLWLSPTSKIGQFCKLRFLENTFSHSVLRHSLQCLGVSWPLFRCHLSLR